jgi:1-acyl-sn-glycerol-3-phosphate acyltransferase
MNEHPKEYIGLSQRDINHESMERQDESYSVFATVRLIVNGFVLLLIPLRLLWGVLSLLVIYLGIKIQMKDSTREGYGYLDAEKRSRMSTFISVMCRLLVFGALGVWHIQDYKVSDEEFSVIQQRIRSEHQPEAVESTDVQLQPDTATMTEREIKWKNKIQTLLTSSTDNELIVREIPAATIVSNHTAPFDPFIIGARFGAISAVAKDDVQSYPIIGSIGKELQCLFITRQNKKEVVCEMFKKTYKYYHSRITEATRAHPDTDLDHVPSILVFPEGTTTAGHHFLKFYTGAFKAGTPVQPVILQYTPYKYYNMGWTANISQIKYFMLHFCQWYQNVKVLQLPVYFPDQHEINDPDLYAENVRSLMAVLAQRVMDSPIELTNVYFNRYHKASTSNQQEV